MTPQSMPIEIGAVVASVNEGRVRLGICTALQGCYARVLGLAAVESNALRSAHAASLDWLDTNKLLENQQVTDNFYRCQINLNTSHLVMIIKNYVY